MVDTMSNRPPKIPKLPPCQQLSLAEVVAIQARSEEPSRIAAEMTPEAQLFWKANRTAIVLTRTKIGLNNAYALNHVHRLVSAYTDEPINPGPLGELLDCVIKGGDPVFSQTVPLKLGGYVYPQCLISMKVAMFDYNTTAEGVTFEDGTTFTYVTTPPLRRTVPSYATSKEDYVNAPDDLIYWFKDVSTLEDKMKAYNFVRSISRANLVYFNDVDIAICKDALPFHIHAVTSRQSVITRIIDESRNALSRKLYSRRVYEGPLPPCVLSVHEIQSILDATPEGFKIKLTAEQLHQSARFTFTGFPRLEDEKLLLPQTFRALEGTGRFAEVGEEDAVVGTVSMTETLQAITVTNKLTKIAKTEDHDVSIVFGSEEWVDMVLTAHQHERHLVLLPFDVRRAFSVCLYGVILAYTKTSEDCPAILYVHTDLRRDQDGVPIINVVTNANFIGNLDTIPTVIRMLSVPIGNSDGNAVIFPRADRRSREVSVGNFSFSWISTFVRTQLYIKNK